MLLRLFRKIYKNKWMFLCLLIGVTLAVAMICSIPIYTRGILQKILPYDMENYNKVNNEDVGSICISQILNEKTKFSSRNYLEVITVKTNSFEKKLGVSVLSSKMSMSISSLNLNETKQKKVEEETQKLETIRDIEKYITIINGKMYSDKKSGDNESEVIVSKKTFEDSNLTLNRTYYLYDEKLKCDSIPIKVVGVYVPKNPQDRYWTSSFGDKNKQGFLMDYNLFSSSFLKKGGVDNDSADDEYVVENIIFDYIIDYNKINPYNYKLIVDNIDMLKKTLEENGETVVSAPIKGLLEEYVDKEKRQQAISWVIQSPIFIMLLFYISMVANLILEEEKNEIALLQSRGVGRRKILQGYFLESIIISIIALIIGPLLGIFICKVLGVTRGFLNFTDRSAINIAFSLKDLCYSLIGIAVFIVTMMLHVAQASRKTIVMHKQGTARGSGKALWQRFYLDVVMILISVYGLKNYKLRQQVLKITSVKATEIPVDPLIYLISTLFIVGIGLFFLRIYPYIVRMVFRLGKKVWSPSGYLSLVNVGREKNNFIMIFLILTISISIFNIKAARTMNSRVENTTRYLTGADVVLQGAWKLADTAGSPNSIGAYTGADNIGSMKPVYFKEPEYSLFSNLKGAESTTKVFVKKDAAITDADGTMKDKVYLMGIITNEFGKTAWFDSNLLKYHWYSYLNLMSKNPQAAIVSENCKEKFNLKKGDKIQVKWTVTTNGGFIVTENGPVELIVYDFVNYWPTYSSKDSDTKYLVIANLQYLQNSFPIDKYQVWIKKASKVDSTKALYENIKTNKLQLENFTDVDYKIEEQRGSSGIQYINAAFNLSFIANIVITTLGFVIYWILSIKGRILQFGILRSMGVTMKKIIRMLCYEQLLISAAAAASAVVIGNITCKLFMNLLDIVTDVSKQLLPVRIITFTNDFIKLALILIFLFIAVLIILGIYILKIKMDQAVKLGED